MFNPKKKVLYSLLNNGDRDYYSELYNSSAFYAPLQNSLVLSRGTGDPTFTRASVARFDDHEGVQREAPSGCVRFTGARFIRNLVSGVSSEAFDSWVRGANVTGTGTNVVWSGGSTAQYGANSIYNVSGTQTGQTVCVTAKVRSNTAGTQLFRLLASGTASSDLTATTSDKIFSILVTENGQHAHGIFVASDGSSADLIVSWMQFEDVTGQANQNPGPYVSVGVLSAPYNQQLQANGVTFDSSATGVDGVAYSKYENGNTVASNVVTEAVGAAIADSTLKGYLSEGSRTNLQPQSAGFGTAPWGAYNGGNGSSSAATAPDGSSDAITLNDTSAAGYYGLYSAVPSGIALTAATYTFSVYVKQGTSTAGFSVWIEDQIVGMAFQNTIAWTGGVPTATGWVATSVGNGWYRIEYDFTGTTNNWVFYLLPAITNATATGSTTFWGVQCELGSFASSYIPTTTAAVTRAADSLTYPASGNVGDSAVTVYAECEFAANSAPGAADQTLIDIRKNDGTQLLDLDRFSATNLAFRGCGINADTGITTTNSTRFKIAAKTDGTNASVVKGGGTPYTTIAGTGYVAATTVIGIGNSYVGAGQLFGNIRNVRCHLLAVPNYVLQRITT